MLALSALLCRICAPFCILACGSAMVSLSVDLAWGAGENKLWLKVVENITLDNMTV
jgi:hypothetical protein